MSGELARRDARLSALEEAAPSDLPMLLDRSEQALELVTIASDAEVEWRQAKALVEVARIAKVNEQIRLRAGRAHLRWERRWGELLGEADEQGRRTDLEPLTAGKKSNADHVARHRAREVAAVPEPIFEKYLTGVRDPERLRRARVLRLAREDQARARRAEPLEPTSELAEIDVRHGDLRDTLDDLAGTADAVITDPPYGAEFLDEYDALGEVAAQLLKPSGVLVAMVGQAHLPAYIERLGRYLSYRWCGAYLMEGPAARIHGRAVGTKWKPLLIFDRGGERRFLTQDVFHSRAPDKATTGQVDGWTQSESGMADIVEHVTRQGELVVDPFLGAGTTAVVCHELNRRFVGCDRDADAVRVARERLRA